MTQHHKKTIHIKIAALAALFPRCFSSRQHGTPYRPLKLDIHLDLAALGYKVPSAIMSSYCHRVQYLKALASGGPRYDLDGNPAGEVSDFAKERAKEKIRQFRGKVRKRQKEAVRDLANPASPA